jgi:hypothetical protein
MLPQLAEKLLKRLELNDERAAVVTFSEHWEVLGRFGAMERIGLANSSDHELTTLFRDICMGLSRIRGTELKQVGLPSGASVDLYLIAEAKHWHVLLVDVSELVEQLRDAQQRAQDAELERYRMGQEARRVKARAQSAGEQREEIRARLAMVLAEREVWRRHILGGDTEDAAFMRARFDELCGNAGAPCALESLKRWLKCAFKSEFDADRLRWQGETRGSLPREALLALAYALLIALKRSGAAVVLEVRSDEHASVLSIADRAQDFSLRESEALWQGRLADEALEDEAEFTTLLLFALGQHVKNHHGRVTRHWSEALRMRLTLSFAEQAPSEAAPILRLPNRVAFVAERLPSGNRNACQLALEALNIEVEEFSQPPELAALMPFEVVLVAPESFAGAAKRLAYQLRSYGFKGRMVALDHVPASAGMKSTFDAFFSAGSDLESLRLAVGRPE